MGESFKSLTIRIGADDSNLQAKLSSISRAARQTQQNLRLIDKALKFDETNASALRKQIQLLGNSAETAATELATIRKTIAQYKGTEIERLANSWSNVAQRAYEVQRAYSANEDAIERIKEKLGEIAARNDIAFDPKKPKESMNALRNLGGEAKELATEYTILAREHGELLDQWREAKTVMQFDNARNQAIKLDSELVKIANDLAEIQSRSTFAKAVTNIEQIEAKTRAFDTALEIVDGRLQRTNELLQLDPTNIERVIDKSTLLYQKVQLTQNEIENLNSELRQLSASGIGKATESMHELAQTAERTKREFVESEYKLRDIQGQIRAESNLIRDLANEIRIATGNTAELEQKLHEAAQRAVALRQEEARMAEQAKAAAKAMADSSAEMEYRRIQERVKSLEDELARLQTKAKNAQIGMLNAARDFATTISATVTPTALMGLYKIIQASDEVDAAYRDMRKTVQGTEEEFQKLYDDAVQMSRTSIVSADQILEIEAMGGQLGIAVDELQEFAIVCSNLDIATDLNTDEVSTQLGQLNTLLEWGKGDMERYGDALVRLGNNMPTTESRISGVTTAIGAAGTMFGMSTPEILAWSAAIASTGQGTEAAGTAISNTMYDIEAAVGEGGDKLQAFADVAGMTAEQFATSWQTEPSRAMEAFVKGLREIDKSGGSATNTLSELGINGVRQIRALLGLSQTIDNLDNALEMSGNAWNGVSDEWGDAGDAANEASKKMEGFSGSLQMIFNNAQSLGLAVGESLAPLLQNIAQAFKALNDIVDKLPDGLLSSITAFTAVVAVAGPVARIVTQGAASFKQIAEAVAEANMRDIEHLSTMKSLTAEERANINSLDDLKKALSKKSNATSDATKTTKNAENANKAYRASVESSTAAEAENTNATKLSTSALKAKAVALAAAKVAAVTLAVEGIIYLSKAFAKYTEDQKNATQATDGMRKAMATASNTVGGARTALDDYRASVGNTAVSIGELMEKQAQATQALVENTTQMLSDVDTVRRYGEQISELTNLHELNNQQVAELQVAVKGLSEATGQALTVEQDQSGMWRILDQDAKDVTDSIYNLIDAQVAQIQFDASKENYSTALNAQRDAANQVAAAHTELAAAEASAREEEELYGYVTQNTAAQIEIAKRNLEAANNAYGSAASQVSYWNSMLVLQQEILNGTATEYDKLINENVLLQSALAQSGIDVNEFSDYLGGLSKSSEEVKDMLENHMTEVVAEFKKTKEESTAAVDELCKNIPENVRTGIDNAFNELTAGDKKILAEVESVTGLTNNEFIWLAQQLGIDGKQGIMNLANGILSNKGNAQDAAKQIHGVIQDNIGNIPSGEWGSHMTSNFAAGMNNAISTIRNATSNILGVLSAIHFSVPKTGIFSGAERGGERSGEHLVENFIEGMKARENALREEAKRLGEIVYSEISGRDYSNIVDIANKASASAIDYAAGLNIVSTARNAVTSSTSNVNYVISGDVVVQTNSDNPQEIVNEIVRVFSVAKDAYSR